MISTPLDTVTPPTIDHDLARKIDHTLLKPDATEAEILRVCDEALHHGFATVCVRPRWARLAAERLKGSPVLAIAVAGFPEGTQPTEAKTAEARGAVADGAREIDMVLNVEALRAREYAAAQEDIRAVVAAAAPWPVKVILETGALTDEEKVVACALAKAAGAAFVKTSTGFGPGGATVEDIALMRRVVGPTMGVKASGGVRTRADALKMITAGATRIGASASVAIVTEVVTSENTGADKLHGDY